ncbi:MAG: hypothetical protein RMZ69_27760 [Nostoc sp. ChiQUE01a]|nr:hypothetical protein [Nostoc sp. ChiQUE01a]
MQSFGTLNLVKREINCDRTLCDGICSSFTRMLKIQKECSLSESVPFDFAQGTLWLEKTFSNRKRSRKSTYGLYVHS